MKTLMAVVLMMGMSFSASAENNCAEIAKLGRAIMEGRQAGVSIVSSMGVAKDNKGVQAMVRLAYMKPRYGSDTYREAAATDFETEVYLICVGGK